MPGWGTLNPMDELGRRYDLRLAAAYVRGEGRGPDALSRLPLDDLDEAALEQTVRVGLQAGVRLQSFKLTADLPRVVRALGVLKGVTPQSILDVGCGRGAGLWPLVSVLPDCPVLALDLLPSRLAAVAAVRRGGVRSVQPARMDVTALALADGAVDVVTALEVLEHVPDVAKAVREVARVARRFVVLSVPSREDDNPGHIHLLDRARLTGLVQAAGVGPVTFEQVPGHLLGVVRTGRR
jgi:2-polyprenyl-3-methyl-5-hydroxy-6-metoxy-1,4-benzoquinol methylase